MASDANTGLGRAAFNSVLIIALGCGIQAYAAPSVVVSCPARTAAGPDCSLRWLVAFGSLPVRRIPLPALQSVDQVEAVRSGPSDGRRGGDAGFTVYLRTATGRTRAVTQAGWEELRTFRDPIVQYLKDEHAPPLHVTMWPNAVPWGWFASVVIGLGLLQGAIVLVQLLRRARASSSNSTPLSAQQ
jgi:hypothetical protein